MAASSSGAATTINTGTLRLALANVIKDVWAATPAAGTSLDLAGFGETIGALTGAGNVMLQSATLTSGGWGSSAVSCCLSGAGGLVKSGAMTTFTLTGAIPLPARPL